jgi:hypothetical protein
VFVCSREHFAVGGGKNNHTTNSDDKWSQWLFAAVS